MTKTENNIKAKSSKASVCNVCIGDQKEEAWSLKDLLCCTDRSQRGRLCLDANQLNGSCLDDTNISLTESKETVYEIMIVIEWLLRKQMFPLDELCLRLSKDT